MVSDLSNINGCCKTQGDSDYRRKKSNSKSTHNEGEHPEAGWIIGRIPCITKEDIYNTRFIENIKCLFEEKKPNDEKNYDRDKTNRTNDELNCLLFFLPCY